jgi:hypothetical protein
MKRNKLRKLSKKIYKCTISGIILYVTGFDKGRLELQELDGVLEVSLHESDIEKELVPCGSAKEAFREIKKREEEEHGRIRHTPLFNCKCAICAW